MNKLEARTAREVAIAEAARKAGAREERERIIGILEVWQNYPSRRKRRSFLGWLYDQI